MREDGAVIGVVGLDGAHVDALGPEGSGPPVHCVQIYRYEKCRNAGTAVRASQLAVKADLRLGHGLRVLRRDGFQKRLAGREMRILKYKHRNTIIPKILR